MPSLRVSDGPDGPSRSFATSNLQTAIVPENVRVENSAFDLASTLSSSSSNNLIDANLVKKVRYAFQTGDVETIKQFKMAIDTLGGGGKKYEALHSALFNIFEKEGSRYGYFMTPLQLQGTGLTNDIATIKDSSDFKWVDPSSEFISTSDARLNLLSEQSKTKPAVSAHSSVNLMPSTADLERESLAPSGQSSAISKSLAQSGESASGIVGKKSSSLAPLDELAGVIAVHDIVGQGSESLAQSGQSAVEIVVHDIESSVPSQPAVTKNGLVAMSSDNAAFDLAPPTLSASSSNNVIDANLLKNSGMTLSTGENSVIERQSSTMQNLAGSASAQKAAYLNLINGAHGVKTDRIITVGPAVVPKARMTQYLKETNPQIATTNALALSSQPNIKMANLQNLPVEGGKR